MTNFVRIMKYYILLWLLAQEEQSPVHVHELYAAPELIIKCIFSVTNNLFWLDGHTRLYMLYAFNILI